MNTVINKFYTGDLNKFGFGTWNSGEQNLKLKVTINPGLVDPNDPNNIMIRMTSEMGYISDMNNPIEGQRQPTIKLESMNEEDKKKKKGEDEEEEDKGKKKKSKSKSKGKGKKSKSKSKSKKKKGKKEDEDKKEEEPEQDDNNEDGIV